MSKLYMGFDVGSVSTNVALVDQTGEVVYTLYKRTQGAPIRTIKAALKEVATEFGEAKIAGVGSTGSGRSLAAVMLGADLVKNEITAHAVAAGHICPGVNTVLEIGGQDSKLIILQHGVVTDFAMNSVCAAGTGSFLDQQAARLGIPIEEFGDLAEQSQNPVRIAGRCSVFAESDMIHKQQMGNDIADIVAGLCAALVRNYLNNLGKGKILKAPVVFQGGVAANKGIKKAFEDALGVEVMVPQHHGVMGAVGSALLARAHVADKPSRFLGFGISELEYASRSFECADCPNNCEVVELTCDQEVVARWGDKCGKWSSETSARTG
ncbi:MAG: 2-hydroxyglutaryl-CoA dehydratase [Firmicutes bacterium]|nr:2-hydroxyglutaryl-CoA dehydratase [Bacillota bacterium]